MSKIGRPKLDNHTTRNRVMRVRLTEAERLDLIQLSAEAGFATLSDFIRENALRREQPVRRPAAEQRDVFSPEDRKALVNLGNNLNQIARVKNSGRRHVMEDELSKTVAKLDELFDRYLPT